MNMDAVLNHPGIERVGWALVHFVWQGAAIALLLAVALRLARRATAAARYTMAGAAMVAMLAAPLATSVWVRPAALSRPTDSVQAAAGQVARLLEAMAPAANTAATEGGEAGASGARGGTMTEASAMGVGEPAPVTFGERLRAWLPWLVLAWMMGVVAMSARQLTAWGVVQRLRRRWVKPVEARWEAALARLAERLAVNRPVRLLESAVVEVPSLIGWLKPVILLPASALTGLTPGQIEAILAHELAHVRRNDYAINLAQTVIETLLFYHPAVWWVSRRVRVERENCCDDLVVQISGDPRGYALALTRMEELRTEASEFAMALTGGELMSRIRRLLGMQETEPVGGRWLAGLVACSLLAAAMVATLTIGTTPATAQDEAQQMLSAEVTSMPGYLEFDSRDWVGDATPTAEITVNDTLLTLFLSTVKGVDPQVAEAIKGINLKLVQLRVFEDLDEQGAAAQSRADEQVKKMMGNNWMPVVRAPEEHVNILMRAEGNRIHGLALIVAEGDELVFGNLVCDVEADKLGTELGGLVNKAMSGQLDISQLAAMFGGMAGMDMDGGGNWEAKPSEPKLQPDGFKTSLEVESMKLNEAEAIDYLGASDGKMVRLDALTSTAKGTIRLEPGLYDAILMMQPQGLEHDAVMMQVADQPARRLFRSEGELGKAGSVRFELAETTDVPVMIQAAETGMLLDRVEFVRYLKPETQTAGADLARD
jgi:beta-lactamase regulating signal transducer with metallopeptidase domain